MSYTRIVYGVLRMHNPVYVSGVKMKTRTKTVESLIWGWTIDSLSNSPIGYQNQLSWNTRHEPSPQIAAQSINCMGSSGGDSGTASSGCGVFLLFTNGSADVGFRCNQPRNLAGRIERAG